MKNSIRILGAGLVCVDIVYDKSSTKIMNGGSCANVLSVLSQVGYDCSVLREKYSDPLESFLSATLTTLRVKQIYYKSSRKSVPRIIEDISGADHSFYTVCPICGKKILTLRLPAKEDVKSVSEAVGNADVFYCDRSSSGLKDLMEVANKQRKIVFYEPNSSRNLNSLLETALLSDIIKFSKDRIPMGIAERIRKTNSRVKLIISTDGAKGLTFSHRREKGEMSPWITIPSSFSGPIVDSSGAGDWLTAGFLSELLSEREDLSLNKLYNDDVIAKTMVSGMKYSQLCCAAIGAQGFFYTPEYSEEFNKLSSHNREIKRLQPENFSFETKNLCPMCFSKLPEKTITAVSL